MRTLSDILYRLGPFLVGVFPEMATTTLLAIILEPSILVGPALWLLEGFASDMVLSFLRLMLLLYVWAILPRRLRHALLRIAAAFLPNRLLCHLSVIPREESKAEVGMDSLDRTRVQNTRNNDRRFQKSSSELSDAAIVIKMAEDNGDHTVQQPKSTKRPPWWKRFWRWTKFGEQSGWDWLHLLVVPVLVGILAVGLTAWFNNQQSERQQESDARLAQQQQEIEDQRAEAERNLAEQRAQDEALQAYLDQMSQLMLDKDLLESQEGDPVYTLAQARTATIVLRLDAEHNKSVINFLRDSGLHGSGEASVGLLGGLELANATLGNSDLTEANLSGASLFDANLIEADLIEANLRAADLSRANLRETNLFEANLMEANLFEANLTEVHLREANVRNAYLNGTNMRNARLDGANLEETDLIEARLIEANLNRANLSGANLRAADLSGASLFDTNLIEADLMEADLSEAEGITNEELHQQAYSLEDATMPNGQKYEEWLKDREGRGEDGE